MATVWIERFGGCHGVAPESVRDLDAQCKARWVRENEPNGNAANAYNNRKDYFEYPSGFADICAESLEVRLVIARRLTELADAQIETRPDDHLKIELSDAMKRRGFRLTAYFSDGLSAARYADADVRELEVPLSAEISPTFMQPAAVAKKWKAKRAAEGNPYAKPAEGSEGWRVVPKEPWGPNPGGDAAIRQLNIRTLQEAAERQRESGLPVDRRDAAWLNELMEEEEAYQADKQAKDIRWQELAADFETWIKRLKAVKELGLHMPPKPAGWDEMILQCDETIEMTARMSKKFLRVGRTDKPMPYRFFWDGISRHWLFGGLFGVVFNGDDGPIETMVLPSYTIPIRARIAPDKALSEWRAIKAYREKQRESLSSAEEPLEELSYELAGEILCGWKRVPLNFTGVHL
ncbi:hypothetical protein QA648_00415 [Rhizobium sp. CB3171]|uniref:hypothetical protein n=1 Tax=Rhizobium sp. CB3171 TaxID=3039157 RepID=UPI0024B22203|nr:hypothetical protein [Rhizobium sp. CB3171]WFU02283.1 hypothetical protein QA648_00415 [Rhizobium sp. CB3171]